MANCGDFFNGLLAKQQRRFSRSTTTKVRTSCLGVEPPADLRPGRAPPADPGAPSATAACGISTAAHSNAAPCAGEENPGWVAAAAAAAASDGRRRETIARRTRLPAPLCARVSEAARRWAAVQTAPREARRPAARTA